MTNEPREQNEPTGRGSNPAAGCRCGAGDGCCCGTSPTGRFPHHSEPYGNSLRDLNRAFLDQPFSFAEAEARHWPGPYTNYSEADRRIAEALDDIERQLFFDGEGS